MARFIERDGDPQIPPPYRFQGVTISSFRLTADMASLQVVCDELLNIGQLEDRGFEYRPVLPFVDLEVLTYPRMESASSRYGGMGYTSQHEVYFRFPVVRYDVALGSFMLPTDVSMFFPYIFVDNFSSTIDGREIIGFPKVLADFRMPAPGKGPYPIVVATQVFDHFSPSTRLDWRTIVKIDDAPAGGSPASAVASWPWGAVDLIMLNPIVRVLVEEALDLLDAEGLFSTVQLKEFRDAENANDACYQALVRSEYQVTNLGAPAPLPPAEISVPAYASLRMAQVLGLPASATLRPFMQYSIECDMAFGNVRNLFVA